MTFAYTITVSDPAGLADDALLTTNLRAALDAWSVFLKGRGVIDVLLSIDNSGAAGASELAAGGSELGIGIGSAGARTIYQSGAAYELATGRDPNDATDDVGIEINAANLASIYFSATPVSGVLPARSYDGLGILEHELGHAFGFDGFRDSTGALDATALSPWDQLVQVTGTRAVFTGAHAQAIYGGPVPVTTTYDSGEAYYHFANSRSDAASTDLLSGTGLPAGAVRRISPLDIAVMADVGTPLSGLGELELAAATVLRFKAFSDLSAATLAVLQPLAAGVEAGTAPVTSLGATFSTLARSTTSVALLTYEFFTQSTPTLSGLDYLISPEGSNRNNLNSAYYAQFNTENRYINFAANLGVAGAGAAAFSAAASSLSLSQVVSNAYGEIFGVTPDAAKVAALIGDLVPNGLGGTETRAQYFASYGSSDLGTKAAAIGWLLSQAASADIGPYALGVDAAIVKLVGADTSSLGVDIVSRHNWIA